MNKRSFLKTSITSAMGFCALPLINGCETTIKPNIGLQLYTLRDLMFLNQETLEYVAKVGYKELETAGYSQGKMYGLDFSDFTIVTDLDLNCK